MRKDVIFMLLSFSLVITMVAWSFVSRQRLRSNFVTAVRAFETERREHRKHHQTTLSGDWARCDNEFTWYPKESE